MTKSSRAMNIIHMIRDLANAGHSVAFTEDFGGDSLTVHIDNRHYHTYAGKRTEEELLKQLQAILFEATTYDEETHE